MRVDPGRDAALDRVGAGLAEGLAAGDVALRCCARDSAAKRTRDTLSASSAAAPVRSPPPRSARGGVRPDSAAAWPRPRRRRRGLPRMRRPSATVVSAHRIGAAGRPRRAQPRARRLQLGQRDAPHVVGRQLAAALGLQRLGVLAVGRAAAAGAHAELVEQLAAARALRGEVDEVVTAWQRRRGTASLAVVGVAGGHATRRGTAPRPAARARRRAAGSGRDRRSVSSALAFSAGSRPSGPPISSATSRPSPRQTRRRSASCAVVRRAAALVEHHAARALRAARPRGAAPRRPCTARRSCRRCAARPSAPSAPAASRAGSAWRSRPRPRRPSRAGAGRPPPPAASRRVSAAAAEPCAPAALPRPASRSCGAGALRAGAALAAARLDAAALAGVCRRPVCARRLRGSRRLAAARPSARRGRAFFAAGLARAGAARRRRARWP